MASRPASVPGGAGMTTPAPSGADPVVPTQRPDISGLPATSMRFRKVWVFFANTASGVPEVHRGQIQRLDKPSGNYAIRFTDGDLMLLPLSGDQAPLWGMGDPPALNDLVLSPETAQIARTSRHSRGDLGTPSGVAVLPTSECVSTALPTPASIPVVDSSSVATPTEPSGAVVPTPAVPPPVVTPSGAADVASSPSLSVAPSASATSVVASATTPTLATLFDATAPAQFTPGNLGRSVATSSVTSVANVSSRRSRLSATAPASSTATAAFVASNLSVGPSERDLEGRSDYLYSVDPSLSRSAGLSQLDSSFQLSLGRDRHLATAPDLVPVDTPAAAGPAFSPGDPVWYSRPSGQPRAALVVAVHRDDGLPYYSISVEGSPTVRDTEGSNLRLRLDSPSLPPRHRSGSSTTPPPVSAFADGDAVWFSRPHCDDAAAIVTAVRSDGDKPFYSVSILGSANGCDADCTQLRPRSSSDGRVNNPVVASSVPTTSVALGFTAARSAASEGGWSGSTVPPGAAPFGSSITDSTGSLPEAPPRQSAFSWSYDTLAQLHSALCGARSSDGSRCRSAALVHPDDDSSALPSCRHHHPLVARCGQPTADGVCLRARPCGTRHDFTTVDPLALAVDQRRASVIIAVDRAMCSRHPDATPSAAVTRHNYVYLCFRLGD